MQYRRSKVKGGTFFFTVNLADRSETLLRDHIKILRIEFAQVKDRHPFNIDGIVILPDHIHSIWTLPDGDHDFSTRWRLIKSGFSRQLPQKENVSDAREKKAERGVWQRRFWEHEIRDGNDFRRHMDYMYYNPVKHGYVERVKDWPFSSFHRDVEKGVYSENWGESVEMRMNMGELA